MTFVFFNLKVLPVDIDFDCYITAIMVPGEHSRWQEATRD